jgi:hypothetical protein
MKKITLLGVAMTLALAFNANFADAQGMAVNSTGAAAATSAMLDVSSTSQGVLVPRMTASQRTAISSPATGLLVFQTDGTSGFYYYNGSAWTILGGGAPSGSAGGDLTGTYPNPTLATSGVTSGTYGSATQVPAYTVDSKGRITAASNTTITGVTPGGAAGGGLTGTYPNPTLASGSVGISQLSASGTAASTTFLRGDNTWATPTATASGSAGGDLTGTYPNPTLTTSGVTSGSYGSASQVPAYTVDAKGRITAAANVTIGSLAATAIASGTIATARLGSGTANSTTFLRGDNTWASPTATPSGSAGGDLTGTYPNPTLSTSGVTAGTYGSAGTIPVITVDAKGRVTSVSTATPATGYVWTTGVNIANTSTSYGPISSVGNVGNSVAASSKALVTIVASTSSIIDKFYVNGFTRGSGSVNTNCTGTIYKNDVATTCAVAFTISSGTTGTPASSTTNNTSCSVSVSPGDRLYVLWTMDQPATGYQAGATISIHAQ